MLVGCNLGPPFTIFVSATNWADGQREGNEDTYCTGGIKARVVVAGTSAETPLVPLGKSAGSDFLMPESAPEGTVMTTEAWCYGEDSEEVAYARVTRPYVYANILTIAAYAPSPLHPYELGRSGCTKPTEQRGPLICLASDLF